MVGVPGEDERHQTTLAGVPPPARAVTDGTVASVAAHAAARRSHAGPGAPRPRHAPGSPAPTPARRGATALPALGGDFLSAALALLCREEPLSRAEIGDHADVVAEVADALAAVADRLAQDLDAPGPDARWSDGDTAVAAELVRARDALHDGSVQTRRGAAELWARHIESLRARLERARGAEPASITPG